MTVLMLLVSTRAQDFITSNKVRFIKIFPKYVEWPDGYKTGDFVIGVMGSSDFTSALSETMASITVGNQPVKVVEYKSASDIGKCHILYISENKSSELNACISKLKKASTLIVTDKEGLITQSTINFVFIDSKLHYELNLKNLTNFGLKYNDNLKTVAAKVIE